MCTPASVIQLILTAALVAGLASCLVLAGRVGAHLREHHAATWRWLGEWQTRWPDGEVQDAALPEYLWSGQYRALLDPQLDRLAFRAKLAAAASIALALALILLSVLFPGTQPFGCVPI